MAALATSPYGPYGQTGPYSQKNDPWNTRRPPQWKPYGFSEGDTGAMMAAPQMQKWLSGLRGPDGAPLEDPGQARASMTALRASNDLGQNLAAGQKVINQRRAQMMDAYNRGDRQTMTPWGYDDTLRQVGRSYAADATPWGDFFAALVGKEALTQQGGARFRADVGGIGRFKGYDPVVGRTIDLEGGERPAPGYTPEEQDYIMSSGPALNALRRASGLRPALPR